MTEAPSAPWKIRSTTLLSRNTNLQPPASSTLQYGGAAAIRAEIRAIRRATIVCGRWLRLYADPKSNASN